MRRITTGIQGGPILGTLTALDNSLSSIETNSNVTLSPNGTGEVEVNSHLQVTNNQSIKLNDSDNSNYVALQAPGTVGTNLTLTLPSSVTNNYYLKTDASGNLSFDEPGVAISDNTVDASQYNLIFTTADSGTVSSVTVSSSKGNFQPSTGTLTATILAGGSATITNNLSAGSITETSSIRYKEEINPITDALESILNLQGVTYKRKTTNTKEAGLLAEEVDKVLPHLVDKKDGLPESISYTKLTAYLIEAVKILKNEIDILKGK